MYNEKTCRPRVIYPSRENWKWHKHVLLAYSFETRKEEKKNVELVLSGMERGCSFKEVFFFFSS